MKTFLICISPLRRKLLPPQTAAALLPPFRTASSDTKQQDRFSITHVSLIHQKRTLLQSGVIIETILIVKYTNKAAFVVRRMVLTGVWFLTRLRKRAQPDRGTREGRCRAPNTQHRGVQSSQPSEGAVHFMEFLRNAAKPTEEG